MEDIETGARSPNDKSNQELKKDGKRTSRACLACRARKSACHLPIVDGVVTTPCERCKLTNLECVIGSSNRGGRRVKKRTFDQAGLGEEGTPAKNTQRNSRAVPASEDHHHRNTSLEYRPGETPTHVGWMGQDYGPGQNGRDVNSPPPGIMLDPALQAAGSDARETRNSSAGSENIAFNDLQNPSDALGILAQIASNGENANPYSSSLAGPPVYGKTPLDYALVRSGRLSFSKIVLLLQRYKHYYHPYFPIVPVATLDAVNLPKTVVEEPHLLTAILVVASRDLSEEPHVATACSDHMRALVSALAAGGPGNVEAVEALLILAEWTPYTSRSDAGQVGRGEEDREAWMHVGTALRIGYFLGLDRYSFHVRGDDAKDPQWQRKRLVWTACYISDRQISIRLGRAFWSRGPGPLTTLTTSDFPMLAPAGPGEEDYASIFQATLELTLLFSNVHDVLYSNPGNSMRNHLAGGYIKYIDDFRSAIYGWKSVWGTLTCSPQLKATLLMSYDYLRLYTNAFAFHATVKRALPQIQQESRKPNSTAPGRVFYNNVGAVGDARFIYEGLDAAKSLLSMVNTFVDPEKSLRYMPLRFYLYSIYSGVFLYRARCVGVLAADEESSVRTMVQETVNRLERSGTGTQHPGSRYAQLLKLLWEKVERKERKGTNSTATLQNPYRPGSLGGGPTPQSSSSVRTHDSPATTEVMGDFSWTDLQAIGDFAVNGNGGLINDAEWWSGFLPADSNNFLFDTLTGVDDWNLGLQVSFSVFPSSYRNEKTTDTEVTTDTKVTVEDAGREDDRKESQTSRRDDRYREDVDIHIHGREKRPVYRNSNRVDSRVEVDVERQRYREPFQRYTDAQIDVQDRDYVREYPTRHSPATHLDLDSRIDIAERDFRDRTTPFVEEYRSSREWQDKSTYPRDYPADRFDERQPVRFEGRTTESTSKKDMGYYDEDGHYHSFRHGLHKAADKIIHPFEGGRHHHHHHEHEHHQEREEDVVVRDTEITMSAPREQRPYSSGRVVGTPNTITIPCHHIRIGDLLILQGRPCQVIRITTSAQTGQHRYLGVDLFSKQLHEESSFVSNPSPSVVVQNMIGPVFKQYRVLDIREDGRVVAMTETGDVKQGLPVLDQSSLLNRLTDSFNNGRGSVRVLVISDEGRELAVDYKVVHGSRL